MCATEDQLLWEKVRNSNAAAFEQLYKKYNTFLIQTTQLMVHDVLVAEELVQQLFVKLWVSRSSISISDNIKGYLCRMRRNMVYDHYKQRETATRYYQHLASHYETSYVHVEESLTAKAYQQQFNTILADMPPRRRLAYQLVRLEGYSCKAVAREFATKERTVRNQVSEASGEIIAKIRLI